MKNDLKDFLNKSHTQYHAVSYLVQALGKAGFKALSECDAWKIKPGDKCYVIRENSAIIAFVIGEDITAGFQIASAHTDSPALKLRISSVQFSNGSMKIPLDVYGGAIRSTWFDRPLGIAGIAGDRLVNSRGALTVLPTPPVLHLGNGKTEMPANNGEINQSVIIPGCSNYQQFYNLLGLDMDIDESELPPAELYLYDVAPAEEISHIWLNAPRLDNLLSCHSAISQLIAKSNEKADFTRVVACFDLEEVGSSNRAGANSNFLDVILRRIVLSQTKRDIEETTYRAFAGSIILSIDAAHAYNPNYPELFDAEYSAYIGQGVVLKRNISQRYATSYSGERYITTLAGEAGVKLQSFEVRAGGRCGSTVGPGLASRLGIETIDLGIAMFAMHSLRETAALSDIADLNRLLAEFFTGE